MGQNHFPGSGPDGSEPSGSGPDVSVREQEMLLSSWCGSDGDENRTNHNRVIGPHLTCSGSEDPFVPNPV